LFAVSLRLTCSLSKLNVSSSNVLSGFPEMFARMISLVAFGMGEGEAERASERSKSSIAVKLGRPYV
jgi:hypothetical protein